MASYRSICEDIMTRMPQELRDLLYEYVLSEEDRHVPATFVDLSVMNAQFADMSSVNPHYFEPEYVGRAMMRELVEYRYSTAEIWFNQEITALGPFLRSTKDYMSVRRG